LSRESLKLVQDGVVILLPDFKEYLRGALFVRPEDPHKVFRGFERRQDSRRRQNRREYHPANPTSTPATTPEATDCLQICPAPVMRRIVISNFADAGGRDLQRRLFSFLETRRLVRNREL